MLDYALYPNRLTEGEDDFLAIPQSLINKKIEDIIRQITKPGSILKETECLAVIHDFFKAIAENLAQGYGFTSEYIRIQPGIIGVFDGIEDKFDESRHQKVVNINASLKLKNALEQVHLQKVDPKVASADIQSVFDFKSQKEDSLLSPGHMIEIKGKRLKFNTEANDEGIFLTSVNGKNTTRVKLVHTNRPGKLTAMLPDDLTAGKYTLEIRNRYRGVKTLASSSASARFVVK